MSIKSTERKHQPRLSRFWRFYLILIGVLIGASLLFLQYVRQSLNQFEAAQPEHYMDGVLTSIRAMSAEEFAAAVTYPELPESRYYSPDTYRLDNARQLLGSELTWTGGAETGDSIVYDLRSDGKKAATVTLRSIGSHVRLGLMSIPEWSLAGIALVKPDLHAFDLTFPSGYRVLINGLEPAEAERVSERPILGYEFESRYVPFPVLVSYRIENLLADPVITAFNNLGEPVPVTSGSGKADIAPVFASSPFPETLKAEVDVLGLAETWSRFLTQDLSGPRYGLETARACFIRDSDFWNMAYAFATGVDITFVSDHRLNAFTNESISEYIRYSDNCFSCVVRFDKNMTLSPSGAVRTDIFNSRLFFVRYDDTNDGRDNPRWYISDMQAIT